MRILDRYIIKSVINIFLGWLFIIFFLYIVGDILTNLEQILEHHISLNILKQYYFSYLPIIFVQTSPLACLLATLYTFAKLNRDNEILAMRSSGLSIAQITQTAIMFGVLVSLLVFLVNDKLVPRNLVFTQKIKNSFEGSATDTKKDEIIDNLSMYGAGNRLYFVTKFYPKDNTMEGITILEHDQKQNITKKIVATKGAYAEGMWKLYNSITYNFDKNGQVASEPEYREEDIVTILETPRDFLAQRERPEHMTISELNKYIYKLSRSGATTVIRNLKVDLYRKYSEPLTSVIIVLLGIPFALKLRKRATGIASFGISLMVGFLYYVFNAVSVAMGTAGILIPILAISLPHIVALTLSLYFISRLP
ncbi:MAG: LptF/LptG family permease [Candidatus Omnitrophota bacterium]|nr:LptF/LptG family permease [Candidatus Omnitrophota bacterium]